jgi:hypothetical protein
MAHGLVDQRQPLRDQLLIPQRAILIVEQNQRAIGIEARGRARVLAKFSLDAEARAIAGIYRTLV